MYLHKEPSFNTKLDINQKLKGKIKTYIPSIISRKSVNVYRSKTLPPTFPCPRLNKQTINIGRKCGYGDIGV